jgi:hypothetical protein
LVAVVVDYFVDLHLVRRFLFLVGFLHDFVVVVAVVAVAVVAVAVVAVAGVDCFLYLH